jgi:hypothetical protein
MSSNAVEFSHEWTEVSDVSCVFQVQSADGTTALMRSDTTVPASGSTGFVVNIGDFNTFDATGGKKLYLRKRSLNGSYVGQKGIVFVEEF